MTLQVIFLHKRSWKARESTEHEKIITVRITGKINLPSLIDLNIIIDTLS